MVDFLSHFGPVESSSPIQHFGLVRVSEASVIVRVLPVQPENARVHWIDGTPRLGWVLCPGQGCPACRVGIRPTAMTLVLVVNFDVEEAQVLAVPDVAQAGSLRSALFPHLKADPSRHLLEIRRDDRKRHFITVRALPPSPDDLDDLAEEAASKIRAGVRMRSAFRSMSPDELARVDGVAKRLKLRDLDPAEDLDEGGDTDG